MALSTRHAPAERFPQDIIFKEKSQLLSFQNIEIILNALPYIACILNSQRQLLFTNKAMLELMNLNDIKAALGSRTGEILNCINAHKTEGGCGTTENCKYCYVVNTIIKSQKIKNKVSNECRITSNSEGQSVSYDFLVEATPFILENNEYTLLTMIDISHEKRRKNLERIFFHDIINIAGGLKGLVEYLPKCDNEDERQEILDFINKASNTLMEEILAQKDLISAENGDLEVRLSSMKSRQFLDDIIKQFEYHFVADDKKMQITNETEDIIFISDIRLVKRIIINMLKNALEASPQGAIVNLGCLVKNNLIEFQVNNPVYMPREVQLQVFQRSFSTKGHNRGLGTYSMKLLTERYLNGSIGFVTSEEEGTTFRIRIPFNSEN